MRKNATLDRLGQNSVPAISALQPFDTGYNPATWQKVIEHEKANRVSRSHTLDVLEYQPCVRESTLQMLSGWHLLFFARAGTTHIQDLRTALQQESERDVQLMQRFKSVQAQYRQHATRESQALSASIPSQAVIAEIRYGGLSIAPGFWLPADMDMGVSLLPATGARLDLHGFTLVEHCKPAASQSLAVLLVVAPPSRTKAELAALRSHPGDGEDLARHTITLCTPVTLVDLAFAIADIGAIDAAEAVGAGADILYVDGYRPSQGVLEEGIIARHRNRVSDLGQAPSASQLIETRQQLLVGDN